MYAVTRSQWSGWISGPISVAGSMGTPTRRRATPSTNFPPKSSWVGRAPNRRGGGVRAVPHALGARRGFARKRDPVPHGVGHQGRAGSLTEALDDVEDARRQVGLADDLGEQRRRERRPLRRL